MTEAMPAEVCSATAPSRSAAHGAPVKGTGSAPASEDPAWNQHLDAVEDTTRLEEWLRLAATLSTGREFLAAIGKPQD